ncbi:uncharacterized protein LOC141901259 isoform X5 [Tubulanus polymorphus]|uniref:uncharacterized protein LOC141901259 isoform X5 n=1 Tax=Tubulanus polymorphus TaxID=672921 RepID=UPI003DA21D05
MAATTTPFEIHSETMNMGSFDRPSCSLSSISDSEDESISNEVDNESSESNKLDTSIESKLDTSMDSIVMPESDLKMLQMDKDKESEVDVEGNDSKQKQNMLLDVLAQVASDTLALEPDVPPPNENKRLTLRTIQSMDVLTLDQIRYLTDKSLVNLFSDMSSDEIKRNYTFTCYLIPSKCEVAVSSFGNEMKARLRMCQHLRDHIKQLSEEYADPKVKFTAEPLHSRRRRALAAKSSGKMKRKRSSNYPLIYSSAKPDLFQDDETKVKRARFTGKRKKMPKKMGKSVSDAIKREVIETDSVESTLIDVEEVGASSEQLKNQQIILDLLRRSQPHHDHSYTSIFGSKGQNFAQHDGASDDELDVGTNTRTGGVRAIKNKPFIFMNSTAQTTRVTPGVLVADSNNVEGKDVIPFMQHSRLFVTPDGMPVYEEEVIEITPDNSSSLRPYPPMPKSDLAMKGKIVVPEEVTSSADEADLNLTMKKKIIKAPKSKEGTAEWEKKLALKCIRELRFKRKDDKAQLICKICKDKTFTAAATLMYHYRSHAGIKPFVCLICHTTFTRQHSLNYHMLIHNNQSRFMCQDCGRKFRHPSHFKEHIRRHTGETPFLCTDCPMKFKTRNTYKRHLRTRHGKLLTAAGIHIMSAEEFKKHRTKPYRQRRPMPFNPTLKGSYSEVESITSDQADDDVQVEDEEVKRILETESTSTTTTSSGVRTVKKTILKDGTVAVLKQKQEEKRSAKRGKLTIAALTAAAAASASTASNNNTPAVVPISKKSNISSAVYLPIVAASDSRTIPTTVATQYIVTPIPNILPSGPAAQGLVQHGFIPQTFVSSQEQLLNSNTSTSSTTASIAQNQYASPALVQAAEEFCKQRNLVVASSASDGSTIQNVSINQSAEGLVYQTQNRNITLDQTQQNILPVQTAGQQTVPLILNTQHVSQQLTPLLLQANTTQSGLTIQNPSGGTQLLFRQAASQATTQTPSPVVLQQTPTGPQGNQLLVQQATLPQGTVPILLQQQANTGKLGAPNIATLQLRNPLTRLPQTSTPIQTLIRGTVLTNVSGNPVASVNPNIQPLLQVNVQPRDNILGTTHNASNATSIMQPITLNLNPINATAKVIQPQITNMNLTNNRGFPYVHTVGIFPSQQQTMPGTCNSVQPGQPIIQQPGTTQVVPSMPVVLPSISSVLPSGPT